MSVKQRGIFVSNTNDYVTHAELKAKDYVSHPELNEIISAISEMFQQSEDRIMNRMTAFIENGVQKRVNVLAERQDSMDVKLNTLTEGMQEVKTRLGHMEIRLGIVEKDVKELKADMKEVKATVSEHVDEIITLRRVK